jgi:hypothetical protein
MQAVPEFYQNAMTPLLLAASIGEAHLLLLEAPALAAAAAGWRLPCRCADPQCQLRWWCVHGAGCLAGPAAGSTAALG